MVPVGFAVKELGDAMFDAFPEWHRRRLTRTVRGVRIVIRARRGSPDPAGAVTEGLLLVRETFGHRMCGVGRPSHSALHVLIERYG
jgi:hypothetical protein